MKLRVELASNKELARRLDQLEASTDEKFTVVFDAIRQLMAPPEPKKNGLSGLRRSSRSSCGHCGGTRSDDVRDSGRGWILAAKKMGVSIAMLYCKT